MKPIKFKLWDKINHKWVDTKKYDIYIDGNGYGYVGFWTEYKDECGYNQQKYIVVKRIDYMPNLSDYQFEVVLWTGLRDSNGKDIYDGDIIQYNCCRGKQNANVFYKDGCFVVNHRNIIKPLSYILEKYKCIVIGNVFGEI